MNSAELRDHCLSFAGAEETFPFGPRTSVFKVAGKMFALSQLELTELLARERRAPEGVVLVLGEQVPEQDHELARDGDRRPARAARGRRPLGERSQGAR